MDIAALSIKCEIPQRKLRYVLDHGLVPGLAPRQQGRGNARQFEELEAISLVVAGSLFQFGVPSAHIRMAFAAVRSLSPSTGGKVAADNVLQQPRLALGGNSEELYFKYGAEWVKLPELTTTGRTPAVVIAVDLAAIRKSIRELKRGHSREANGKHGGSTG